MTTKSGPKRDMLEDKSRRYFARNALAAGGALLLGPKLMAAPLPAADTAMGSAPFSRHIYFYYLTPGSGHPKVRAYYIHEPNFAGNINARVGDWIKTAEKGDLTPVGYRMGAIVWCRQSYIVVVLNDPNHRLKQNDGVAFRYKTHGGGKHHSFHGGNDLNLSGALSGWYCLNHLIKEGGVYLKKDEFEYFDVAVNIPDLVRNHNDTGTNTGPP